MPLRFQLRRCVAQIFNLLYRRIAFCTARRLLPASTYRKPCRLQIGDTADCKSALLFVAPSLVNNFFDSSLALGPNSAII
jgi:hypothetical protein